MWPNSTDYERQLKHLWNYPVCLSPLHTGSTLTRHVCRITRNTFALGDCLTILLLSGIWRRDWDGLASCRSSFRQVQTSWQLNTCPDSASWEHWCLAWHQKSLYLLACVLRLVWAAASLTNFLNPSFSAVYHPSWCCSSRWPPFESKAFETTKALQNLLEHTTNGNTIRLAFISISYVIRRAYLTGAA